jgi:hypothetical protein
MLRLALHVDYDDGSSADVIASALDIVNFERKFNKPITVFADEVRVEYLLELAFSALQRKKLTTLEFDEWADTISGITFGNEDDTEIVPLESNPPTGS